MINIPSDLLAQYKSFMSESTINVSLHTHYIKWLRYFLDFCTKYNYSPNKNDSLKEYVKKLHQKNQNTQKQKQAINSVLLYFELLKRNKTKAKNNHSKTVKSNNTKNISKQSFTRNNTTDSESEKDIEKTSLKIMINYLTL